MQPPQTLSTQISAIDGAAVRERVKYARCVRVFKAAPNTTTEKLLLSLLLLYVRASERECATADCVVHCVLKYAYVCVRLCVVP